MTEVWIDNLKTEVPAGSTILQAARQAGIVIPTLCHLDGCDASTSCFVCVVRIEGQEHLAPSCATVVREGMRVHSEVPEVHAARKTALELLLSDHLGDCRGPCQTGCPAGMNIPRMIRQIAAGDFACAIATIKADIPLPATLGRVCPAPCEKVCRRKPLDASLSICLLKRFVGDWDLAQPAPYLPARRPTTGKRVAIVGAGPAGLAAAYYLLCDGHEVVVHDEHEQAGGMLRYGLIAAEGGADRLPPAVLDAEIAVLAAMGAKFELGRKVYVPSQPWRAKFDAVVLATGATGRQAGASDTGVFVAGAAAGHGGRLAVRAVADGHARADKVTRFLAGNSTEPKKVFNCRMGRLLPEEMERFAAGAVATSPVPSAHAQVGLSESVAKAESLRCLHCDCRKAGDEHAGDYPCKLRRWAQEYQADPRSALRQVDDAGTLAGRRYERQEHPQLVYESGKCIACGLCVQIAAREGETLGLAFIGRGFDVRIGVPFGRPLSEALAKCAPACAATCPTGALSIKT